VQGSVGCKLQGSEGGFGMKPTTPLQSIVEPFVKSIGGELISELVGNDSPPSSADYLFRRHNVIAELKSLQAESFGDPFRRKLGNRMGDWQRDGRLIVFGTTKVESKRLAPECQNDVFNVMASPLQKNVVGKANSQIGRTKEILNMPDAKGLLWVASDGNEDLQPNDVWFLLTRILQKTDENGTPLFSNIHGLAYFSPRMLVQMSQSEQPAIFWFSGCRHAGDSQLVACLNELYSEWPQYVARTQRIVVQQIGGRPENVHFPGVLPRMPRIQINHEKVPG
jgi:hypothetical protein